MKQFALRFFVRLAIAAGVSGYACAPAVGEKPSLQAVMAPPQPAAQTSAEFEAAKITIDELRREIDRLNAMATTNRTASHLDKRRDGAHPCPRNVEVAKVRSRGLPDCS